MTFEVVHELSSAPKAILPSIEHSKEILDKFQRTKSVLNDCDDFLRGVWWWRRQVRHSDTDDSLNVV